MIFKYQTLFLQLLVEHGLDGWGGQTELARRIKKRKSKSTLNRQRIHNYVKGTPDVPRETLKEIMIDGLNYAPDNAEKRIAQFEYDSISSNLNESGVESRFSLNSIPMYSSAEAAFTPGSTPVGEVLIPLSEQTPKEEVVAFPCTDEEVGGRVLPGDIIVVHKKDYPFADDGEVYAFMINKKLHLRKVKMNDQLKMYVLKAGSEQFEDIYVKYDEDIRPIGVMITFVGKFSKKYQS